MITSVLSTYNGILVCPELLDKINFRIPQMNTPYIRGVHTIFFLMGGGWFKKFKYNFKF